jgi:mono/diheme cytochrome c family protein
MKFPHGITRLGRTKARLFARRDALARVSVPGLVLLACALASTLALAADTPPYVAGYERMKHSPVEAGEILLSELSCLACHRDGSKLPQTLVFKPGPNLGAVGDRLRAQYVREFLLQPATTKPGTTMPDLLSGQPLARRAELADDLTHFLMQLRGAPSESKPLAGAQETGRDLYHSVGCVACHSAAPLTRLAEKYGSGQLAHFLVSPLEARPAGRMPDLHLTAQEAADIAAFIAPEAPAGKAPFAIDPAKAGRGAQVFTSLGCVSCHGGAGEGKPLADLNNLAAGCLSGKPAPSAPFYPLSAAQRTALQSALQGRAERPPPDDPKRMARHHLLQRNCFACHARDGLGGPPQEIAEHFTSTRDDLGDLGRLPPPLDGVGRKLQPAALENILRGEQRVRDYMRVRMPNFGPEFAEHLAPLFARADLDPNETPTVAKREPNKVGRNEAGRRIVGTHGYSCIACHSLYGHASLGIGAYDLAEMPKRLRPEWMRDFLLQPAAYPTGSRMPAFWPGGKPMNTKLDGDAERQIDSIRVYLSEVDQSLPPEGFLDQAASELKPKDRPIVFRTFIEGAGAHAIAVGFPQGVNVAFDALNVRWALAWRGRFLDADGTWHQRAAKNEKPLGENLVSLEGAGALRLVGQNGAAPEFRGYRLDASGVPTFLYDLGALHIEDRIVASTGPGMRRTLRVSGQTNEAVEFYAQPSDRLKLEVADTTSFPTALRFTRGCAEIVQEISW